MFVYTMPYVLIPSHGNTGAAARGSADVMQECGFYNKSRLRETERERVCRAMKTLRGCGTLDTDTQLSQGHSRLGRQGKGKIKSAVSAQSPLPLFLPFSLIPGSPDTDWVLLLKTQHLQAKKLRARKLKATRLQKLRGTVRPSGQSSFWSSSELEDWGNARQEFWSRMGGSVEKNKGPSLYTERCWLKEMGGWLGLVLLLWPYCLQGLDPPAESSSGPRSSYQAHLVVSLSCRDAKACRFCLTGKLDGCCWKLLRVTQFRTVC